MLSLLRFLESINDVTSGDGWDVIKIVSSGSTGAGLAYLFMKGSLAQMSSWKVITEAANARASAAEKEISASGIILDQLREELFKAREEMAICHAERKTMVQEITHLRAEVAILRKEVRNGKS
jgi:hypothetical protein